MKLMSLSSESLTPLIFGGELVTRVQQNTDAIIARDGGYQGISARNARECASNQVGKSAIPQLHSHARYPWFARILEAIRVQIVPDKIAQIDRGGRAGGCSQREQGDQRFQRKLLGGRGRRCVKWGQGDQRFQSKCSWVGVGVDVSNGDRVVSGSRASCSGGCDGSVIPRRYSRRGGFPLSHTDRGRRERLTQKGSQENTNNDSTPSSRSKA